MTGAPDGPRRPGSGVYVHVPFCRARCDYCAFATFTDRDHLMDAYAAACRTELARAVEEEGLAPATSVFVGGGTPSRLPADLLASVLEAAPRAPGCEVTVECNPEDVTDALLAAYRAAGVTRISLGVQSTVPGVLAGLGRHGSDRAAEAAARVAGAGFASWNVDLIAGAAGESADDWERTLTDVLALADPPPHLSVYPLAVEPGTALAADPGRHPDEDVQADRYERTEAVLAAAGYAWEEVANWARPGHGCRHNRLYWSQGDYRGIGSGAHSHRDGHRWWNVRTPDRYVDAVTAGRSPRSGEEHLAPAERAFERLALALRTPVGVPVDALPPAPELAGLVVRSGDRAVLTVRGRLLANEVTARLVVDPATTPGAGAGERAGTMPSYV